MAKRKQPRRLSQNQRRLRYSARKALLAAAVVLVVGLLIAADRLGVFGHTPVPDAQKYQGRTCRVVRVIDGDTLDVDVPDGRSGHTRVRLWGVDTPETVKPNSPVQHFGPEASAFTKRQAGGKEVRLELYGARTRGDFGRLLAYVVLPDGRMLNRALIEQGFGYADPRFDHPLRAEFQRLQNATQAARRGLWKNLRRSDLPRCEEIGSLRCSFNEFRMQLGSQ